MGVSVAVADKLNWRESLYVLAVAKSKGLDSPRFDEVELVEFPMSKRELGRRGK